MRNAPNVSHESRRRVLEAARELGYRPNAFARSLASKQTRTIGVLITDTTNPYFGSVYASIAAAADRAGYDLLVAPGTRSAAKETHLINTLLEHRVAGLVLLTPLMPTRQLGQACTGWPTVVIGREVSLPGVDVVTTDEVDAARMIISRLMELGHRDIAHLTGGSNRPARDRAAAYRRVMAEFGLQPREVQASFSERGGQLAGRSVTTLRPLPTAVVAANDLIAVGAMGVFRSAGLRVPDDISVVGFDDSQIAQLALVQLTSVQQPIDQFGVAAVTLLADRLDEAREGSVVRRIPASMVERATSGPASSGRAEPARSMDRRMTTRSGPRPDDEAAS
jgi:DNA-binding LacI/PurR family transcriptional regulator